LPETPPDNSRPKRFWTHAWTWLWLGCWAGLFVLTHIPVPKGMPPIRVSDKVIHGVAYFVLAMLGGRAALKRGRILTWRWIAAWTVVYALYAAGDERLQSFVGRTCDVLDWLFDVLGVGLAMAILALYGAPAQRADSHDGDEPTGE
jgi:VanZ family protein